MGATREAATQASAQVAAGLAGLTVPPVDLSGLNAVMDRAEADLARLRASATVPVQIPAPVLPPPVVLPKPEVPKPEIPAPDTSTFPQVKAQVEAMLAQPFERLTTTLGEVRAAKALLDSQMQSATTAAARAEITQLSVGLDSLEGKMRGAAVAQSGMTVGAGSAQGILFGLVQTTQDVTAANGDFGLAMRYAGNNVIQLTQLAGGLASQAAAAGTTLTSTLIASLAGPTGLLVGAGAIAALLPTVIGLFGDSGDAAEESGRKVRSLADSYRDAVSAAVDLTVANQAALQSTIDRTAAELKFGATQSLDDILNPSRPSRPVLDLTPSVLPAIADLGRLTVARDASAASGRAAAGATGEEAEALRALGAAAAEESQRRGRESRVDRLRRDLGLSSPDEVRSQEKADRDAQRATARAATRAATEARTRARQEAAEARRNAAEAARDRAQLTRELDEAEAHQGLARDLITTRQKYRARLDAAHGDAQLRLRVETQYAADVQRLQDADQTALIDRQLAGIEAVRRAREAADEAAGQTDEALLQRQIDQIASEAETSAAMYVERAEANGQAVQSVERLTDAIRVGTFETAEELALVTAMSPELQGVLDLTLRRMALEQRLLVLTRDQRIEREKEARAVAGRARERADRLGAIQRPVSRGRDDAAARVDQTAQALARAQAAVADVDAALAALGEREQEVAQTQIEGGVEVEAARIRDAQQIRDLSTERLSLVEQVRDAEIEAAEAAAEQHKLAAEAQVAAARQVVGAFAQAATANIRLPFLDQWEEQSRLSDAQVDDERERFRQQEADLRDSLDRRETTQQEAAARLREMREQEAAFERRLNQERESVFVKGLRASLREGLDQVAAYLKKRATAYAVEVLFHTQAEAAKTASTEAGTIARLISGAAEIAGDLAKGAASMVSAAAKWISDAVSKFGIFSLAAIPVGVAGLYGAYKGVQALFGFRSGGYTGDGDPGDVAGPVHRGEVVLESGIVRGQVGDVMALRALLQSGVSAADLVALAGAPDVASLGAAFSAASPVAAFTAPVGSSPATAAAPDLSGIERQFARLADEVVRTKTNPTPVYTTPKQQRLAESAAARDRSRSAPSRVRRITVERR